MDPVNVPTPPATAVMEGAASPLVARWSGFIAEAAQRFGLPRAWIAWVMKAESGGRTHLGGTPITSRAGAMGLMQLMPATYAEMARTHGLGPDPYEPRDNILAGAAYLAVMRERFGYPGLFAAYNVGPGRYADHLRTGQPLPAETQSYVAALAKSAGDAAPAARIPSGRSLFFALSASVETSAVSPLPVQVGSDPDEGK